MSVIISSAIYWADWPHASDATFEVRAKSSKAWISAEMEIVPAGESRVVGTGSITALRPTLPSITLPATSAGLDDQTSRWTVTLHRTGRKGVVSTVLGNFPLPSSFEPSTTWAQIKINKNGKQALQDTSVYTKTETNNQIALAVGDLNDASDVVKGRTYLSVAPNGDPIAVGDNDPRNGTFYNVRGYPYLATGDGSTDDTASFRACIAAMELAGPGRTLYVPAGRYRVADAAAAAILTFTKNFAIEAEEGAELWVTSAGASTDIILVNPPAGPPAYNVLDGVRIRNLRMVASTSARPGRHAICVKTSNANTQIKNSLLDNVKIGQRADGSSDGEFGSFAIAYTNPNADPNAQFTGTIRGGVFYGGIQLDRVSDSFRVHDAQISSLVANRVGFDVDLLPGATGPYFVGNNSTAGGGVIIRSAEHVIIGRNIIETANPALTTSAVTPAVIQLKGGGSATRLMIPVVENNVLRSTITGVHGIIVHLADRTYIGPNEFYVTGAAGAGVDPIYGLDNTTLRTVTVTASALTTRVCGHQGSGTGSTATSLLGTNDAQFGTIPFMGLNGIFLNEGNFAVTGNFQAGAFFQFANGVLWTHGTGDPNGVRDGHKGSFFSRTDGAPGSIVYAKTTALGTLTGWVAIA